MPGPLTILVVDAAQPIRRRIAECATELACSTIVVEAGSVGEARQLLATVRPGAVIVDPVVAGHDFLEFLRELRGTSPDLVLLVLTAHDSDSHRRRSLEAGADAFASKVTDFARFEQLLHGLCGGQFAPGVPTPRPPSGLA